MAYSIKGNINATNGIKVQGKNVGATISTTENETIYSADENGHLELPVSSSSEVDFVLNQLPLTQYGSINNNPIGVAGTFDGGSTVSYYSYMPIHLEDDGTVIILRPGTNGSTLNYYYTYINSPDSSMKPTTTIEKYYSGTSKNILFYDSYTKDTLIYDDLDNKRLHIVLTNGTLHKEFHKEANIARSLIPYNIMSALKVGNYVYIIALYNSAFNYNDVFGMDYNVNDPLQFVFYRIPVSEINAGVVNTVQQVTGISGKTMNGTQLSGLGAARVAGAWASTIDSSTESFIKYQTGLKVLPFTYSIIGAAKSYFDGTNIIFSFYTNCLAINNTQRYDTMFGISISFNVNTNSYTTDVSAAPVTVTGQMTGALTWNNPYSVTSANIYGIGQQFSDANSSSWYITDSGVQYAVTEKYVLRDTYMVTKSNITNFTNKANAYKIRNRQLSNTGGAEVPSDFASRVGDQLTGGSPISSTRIMFTGTGTYNGRNYTKYFRGIADIGTTRNYTYNSFSRGTITGYAPQAFRVPFGDDNEQKMHSKISLCDAAGNVKAYGCAFFEDQVLSTGYQLNPNTITYDTNISISNTTLINLKNSILASAGITSPASSKIGLYFVPDGSYCKSIATVAVYNGTNLGGQYVFATVDCTLSSGVVSVATLNTIIKKEPITNMQFITEISEIFAKSGLSCVKYNDFTYISFSALFPYAVGGDMNELSCCGVVNGNTVSNFIVSQSYHAQISPYAREYSYIPNLGFGYYIYYNNDRGTKLIFRNCGNTLAQYNANMSAGNGTDVVILAQDVPEGFYLYFTEITPLFMSGKYFDVPISSISLDQVTPNPANKTFYVYIQLSVGSPKYVASLTSLQESNTNMFIGTITTDGTKVSSLNINKVSRFDLYRPSLTQIGAAFPVSSGNPTQQGSIGW